MLNFEGGRVTLNDASGGQFPKRRIYLTPSKAEQQLQPELLVIIELKNKDESWIIELVTSTGSN